MFEPEAQLGRAAPIVMVAVTFLAPFVYDALHKSPLGKDPKIFGGDRLRPRGRRRLPDARTAASATAPTTSTWPRSSARSWPSTCGSGSGRPSRRSSRAVKEGTAPDAALVALAGARSRHNTYMSVPLALGHDQPAHRRPPAPASASPAPTASCCSCSSSSSGWHIVWQLYKRARRRSRGSETPSSRGCCDAPALAIGPDSRLRPLSLLTAVDPRPMVEPRWRGPRTTTASSGVARNATRGRDQARLPPARPQVPPRPGARLLRPRTSRSSRPPTRPWPTPSAAGATTRPSRERERLDAPILVLRPQPASRTCGGPSSPAASRARSC